MPGEGNTLEALIKKQESISSKSALQSASSSNATSRGQNVDQLSYFPDRLHRNSALLSAEIEVERVPETFNGRHKALSSTSQKSSRPDAKNINILSPFGPSLTATGSHEQQRAASAPPAQDWSLPGPWISNTQIFRSLYHNLSKLRVLQKDATSLRLLCQQLRKQLNEQREQVAKRDAEFIALSFQGSSIRSPPDEAAVQQVYNAAQDARNAQGPVEDECERLELELGRVELAMMQRSESIESQLRSLGFNGAQDFDWSRSDDLSSHYSFETNLPDADLMHLPRYTRSDLDIQEQGESLYTYNNHMQSLSKEGNLQGSSFQAFTAPQNQIQKQTDPAILSENINAGQISEPKAIALGSGIIHGLKRSGSDVGVSFMPPIGPESVAPEPISPYPKSSMPDDTDDLEDLGKLQDIEDAQRRVNRWVLGVLLSSKVERSRFESQFPPDLTAFSLHPHDFLRIWDSDSAVIPHIVDYNNTDSATRSVILDTTVNRKADNRKFL